ncbi:MAG: 3-deoxy-manno-octulosonate cytidylyltransferase [Bacteroidia bacterium]|nr:3-deoxy-manno-octulosonate cytidylyltransferase [Bacteroidia bacterium]
MKVLIVIPSRFGSTRFTGKPLIDIAGKSLVRRTYEQALKVQLDCEIIVATDNQDIYDHVKEFGNVMMTSEEHFSGTDRCFEVLSRVNGQFDVMINLQGDEPFILPSQIESLVEEFGNIHTDIASLQKPITQIEELHNPNIVKVVTNKERMAMLFSRQAIPYNRGIEQQEWVTKFPYKRHIGIYAFRTSICAQLSTLETGNLEKAEMLEQLRWLENGYNIRMANTDFVSPAIDSPEDLITVDNFLKMNPDMI